MLVFAGIHKKVRKNLLAAKAEMMVQQHKRTTPVAIKIDDTIMVHVPARDSKLVPKFMRSHLVMGKKYGNKGEVFHPFLRTVDIFWSDILRKTRATDANLANNVYLLSNLPPSSTSTNTKPIHTYNL